MNFAVTSARIKTFISLLLVLVANLNNSSSFSLCNGAWRRSGQRFVINRYDDVQTGLQSRQRGVQPVPPRWPTSNAVLHDIVFRGRGIPYVETYEEQQLRLWLLECEPFVTAQRVVSSVLDLPGQGRNISNKSMNQPLLRRLKMSDASDCLSASDEKLNKLTGYEDLFQTFYSHGCGSSAMKESLPTLFSSNPDEKVQHFALVVAYHGDDFCGWQRQPNNKEKNSVQAMLEDSLQTLMIMSLMPSPIPSSQMSQKCQYFLQKPPNIRVCGRTDAGVHAVGQICRLRATSEQNMTPTKIQNHLNEHLTSCVGETMPPQQQQRKSLQEDATPRLQRLKCLHVQRVPRGFHPTFGATCRAYTYLIDIAPPPTDTSVSMSDGIKISRTGVALTTERVERLNDMLQYLEGKDLDYVGLSYGRLKTQTSNCTLYHAKACLVEHASSSTVDGTTCSDYKGNISSTALCIELVGNRFLRRMVRLLVSTALQIALPQRPSSDSAQLPAEDALYKLILERDRALAHRPAPPDGLIFVGARFS